MVISTITSVFTYLNQLVHIIVGHSTSSEEIKMAFLSKNGSTEHSRLHLNNLSNTIQEIKLS